MSKLQEFIAYLEEQVANHSIYVWGAQGQKAPKITEAWIWQRESTVPANQQYDSKGRRYYDLAVASWKKQCAAGYGDVLRAFDCSGLGMYFLYNLHGIIGKDLNSGGMKNKCTIIDASARRAGCWLFRWNKTKSAISHIGYMVEDDYVIHAKGREDGIIKEKYKASYWHLIGVPDCFADDLDDSLIIPDADELGDVSNFDYEGTGVGMENGFVAVVYRKGMVRLRKSPVDGETLGIIEEGVYLPYIETVKASNGKDWYHVDSEYGEGYITANPKYTKLVQS